LLVFFFGLDERPSLTLPDKEGIATAPNLKFKKVVIQVMGSK